MIRIVLKSLSGPTFMFRHTTTPRPTFNFRTIQAYTRSRRIGNRRMAPY